MPSIGITGHMNLTPATVGLVRAALKSELVQYDPRELVGVSCLAEGADAIFAQVVLELDGRIEALIPARDYRATRVGGSHLAVFDDLVRRAHKTRYIAEVASMQAYADANAEMIASVDRLLAVWDGQPSPEWRQGGTADAVAAARATGVPVTVVWPEGAQRS